MESIANLINRIKQPENSFKPVAFWFLNHYPEPSELKRQIREMADKGFGGIMLHARNGLRGGYLNPHWKDAIRWSVDEAKRLGLEVYLYDELNYPSGPAGNMLFDACPDTAMRYLELKWEQHVAPGEDIDPQGPFLFLLASHPDGTTEKITTPWKNDSEISVSVLGFSVYEVKEYPDYLDADAMREFVRLSYSWYAERFKDDMGSVIKGEFTDNACANFGFIRRSIPWTPLMAKKFKDKTGLEFELVLPSLFLETPCAALHRIIYWGFLNELFLETFVMPIEQECAANGIAATGHYCIEQGTSEHVRQLGDRFDQKRHQHIPGVDMLGSSDFEKLDELLHGTAMPLAIPMTASPAYFMHNSRVLCECFGLSAGWAMTLSEMRRIGGLLCVLGVDIHVPHGIFYSIAGHRKRECIPDFMHNTMWENFDRWSIWTGRICSLTAFSEHVAETAIFYSVLAQQASIELGNTGRYGAHGERCDRIDRASRAAAECLLAGAIGYEMIDESLVSSAEIVDGELLIRRPNGTQHAIRTLIMPSAWVVRSATFDKLKRFRQSGGVIIALNEKLSRIFDGVQLVDIDPGEDFYTRTYAVESISDLARADFKTVIIANLRRSQIDVRDSTGRVVVREWISEGRSFVMLHNTARDRVENVQLHCRFATVPVSLDLDRVVAEQLPWRGSMGDYQIDYDFDGGESLILTMADSDVAERAVTRTDADFQLEAGEWNVELESPNTLRLPEWQVSENGHRWATEFEIDELPGQLGIALDLEPTDSELRKGIHPFSDFWCCIGGNMVNQSRVKCLVNGRPVSDIRFGTHFDRWIYEGEVGSLVVHGRNTVEILKPTSLLESNAVPDPVILFGRFGVRNGAIVSVPKTLATLRWDNTELANYSGAICFRRSLKLPESLRGKPLRLDFECVNEIVQVSINGKDCGTRVMPPWKFEIPAELSGTDIMALEIRLTNTPSNRWKEPRISGIVGSVKMRTEVHREK